MAIQRQSLSSRTVYTPQKQGQRSTVANDIKTIIGAVGAYTDYRSRVARSKEVEDNKRRVTEDRRISKLNREEDRQYRDEQRVIRTQEKAERTQEKLEAEASNERYYEASKQISVLKRNYEASVQSMPNAGERSKAYNTLYGQIEAITYEANLSKDDDFRLRSRLDGFNSAETKRTYKDIHNYNRADTQSKVTSDISLGGFRDTKDFTTNWKLSQTKLIDNGTHNKEEASAFTTNSMLLSVIRGINMDTATTGELNNIAKTVGEGIDKVDATAKETKAYDSFLNNINTMKNALSVRVKNALNDDAMTQRVPLDTYKGSVNKALNNKEITPSEAFKFTNKYNQQFKVEKTNTRIIKAFRNNDVASVKELYKTNSGAMHTIIKASAGDSPEMHMTLTKQIGKGIHINNPAIEEKLKAVNSAYNFNNDKDIDSYLAYVERTQQAGYPIDAKTIGNIMRIRRLKYLHSQEGTVASVYKQIQDNKVTINEKQVRTVRDAVVDNSAMFGGTDEAIAPHFNEFINSLIRVELASGLTIEDATEVVEGIFEQGFVSFDNEWGGTGDIHIPVTTNSYLKNQDMYNNTLKTTGGSVIFPSDYMKPSGTWTIGIKNEQGGLSIREFSNDELKQIDKRGSLEAWDKEQVKRGYRTKEISNNKNNLLKQRTTNYDVQSRADKANKYLGGKYVWGGTSLDKGTDCSGFVQNLLKEEGIKLPRTASQQSKIGTKVTKDNLQVGDLLYFEKQKTTDIYKKGAIYHTGIVTGFDDKGNPIMTHSANTRLGVVRVAVTPNSYYGTRLVFGRRH